MYFVNRPGLRRRLLETLGEWSSPSTRQGLWYQAVPMREARCTIQALILEAIPARSEDVNRGDATPVPKEATTVQLLCITRAVYLGAFVAALRANVVATLSGPISASFGSMSLLSRLASYFIANAASQPLSGRSTDIYGGKAGFIFCKTSFAIGNLICGSGFIGIAIMSILSGVIMSWTGMYYILNAVVESVFLC